MGLRPVPAKRALGLPKELVRPERGQQLVATAASALPVPVLQLRKAPPVRGTELQREAVP